MNWPIWNCLTPECREKLRQYQERWFKEGLKPPSFYPEIESLEEIDKLMRQPPKYTKGLPDD